MSMNREQKRMLQRQARSTPTANRSASVASSSSVLPRSGPGCVQFGREVRAELRKVAWPSRSETGNYTTVVIITIIAITVVVAGLDWLFSVIRPGVVRRLMSTTEEPVATSDAADDCHRPPAHRHCGPGRVDRGGIARGRSDDPRWRPRCCRAATAADRRGNPPSRIHPHADVEVLDEDDLFDDEEPRPETRERL